MKPADLLRMLGLTLLGLLLFALCGEAGIQTMNLAADRFQGSAPYMPLWLEISSLFVTAWTCFFVPGIVLLKRGPSQGCLPVMDLAILCTWISLFFCTMDGSVMVLERQVPAATGYPLDQIFYASAAILAVVWCVIWSSDAVRRRRAALDAVERASAPLPGDQPA